MATPQQQLPLLRQYAKNDRNDVSAIQQALKQYGYYPGNVDGVFGPKTAKAVNDFQKTTGIKVDSIVGPQTRGQLDDWKQNPGHALMNDPIIQHLAASDPTVAKTLQNAQGNQLDTVAAAHALANKGYYLSPGVFVDGANMQAFYDLAKKELDPEWNERLNFYKNDFQSSIDKERADYQDALANKSDDIYNTKKTLDTQQAQNNNIDSSYGAKQRDMFEDSSNRDLNALQRNSSYKLSDLARNYENNFGSGDVGQFNTNLANPGQVGSTGYLTPGSGTKSAYTPMGGFQGQLRQKYAAQISQYGKQKAGAAYGYPTQ